MDDGWCGLPSHQHSGFFFPASGPANSHPPLMLIGGEDLLAPARFPPPIQARRLRLLRARGRRDGRERADPGAGRRHRGRDPGGRRGPVAARAGRGRRRRAAPCLQRRPAARGGARIARGRVRPPQPDVRAPAVARARLFRQPADRPAHVARDGRPSAGSLLPRLRPDLAGPVSAHDRDRGRGHDRPGPVPGPRGARPHTVGDLDRIPLRPAESAGDAGGPAADRGAHRRGRGEHRWRARGQGVRAGAPPAAPLQQNRDARVRPVDGLHTPARVLLAVHRVPAAARARGAAARRRASGDQRHPHHRRVHRLLRIRAVADWPDARARHGARDGAARRRDGDARVRAPRPSAATRGGSGRRAAAAGRRACGAPRRDLRLRRRRAGPA